jgi:hypothetical protein
VVPSAGPPPDTTPVVIRPDLPGISKLHLYLLLSGALAVVEPGFCFELAKMWGQGRIRCRVAISTTVLRDATHWDDVVMRLGHEHLRRHDLRHTGLTWMERRGVASDATFRVRREDGAVRGRCPGTAGRRTRRQSEPAGQDGRDRAVLRQVPGCCVHSGCIRRKHDAAKQRKSAATRADATTGRSSS